jgi:hypothetical protein
MNTADPFKRACGLPGYNWIGALDASGDVARMRESWWHQPTGPYVNGAAFPTAQLGVQPAMAQLTASNTGTTVATTTNVSMTTNSKLLTVVYTGGAVRTAEIARPLEVRRYYHWNKPRTAGVAVPPGTTDMPSTPQEEGAAHGHTVPDVLGPVNGEGQVMNATESEAVQITEYGHRRRPLREPVRSSRSLTQVAVLLAGQKRSAVGMEWRGHLLGEPEHGLTQREQIRAAGGFVWAAIRYRLQDATDQAWRPIDAVLRSRTWSNLFVLIPTTMVSLLILRDEGALGVVKSAESIGTIGGSFYWLLHAGRRRRDVKPPDPKVRHVKGE